MADWFPKILAQQRATTRTFLFSVESAPKNNHFHRCNDDPSDRGIVTRLLAKERENLLLVQRARAGAMPATFASFQDHAVYKGRQVFFYKRAQIFVADVWGAFGGKGCVVRVTMVGGTRVSLPDPFLLILILILIRFQVSPTIGWPWCVQLGICSVILPELGSMVLNQAKRS